MKTRQGRRFSIADAMILIIASAVGATFLRSYLPGFFYLESVRTTIIPDPWKVWWAYFWLSEVGSCLVIPLMAALIVIQLRQPRPSRARLARLPGFVACVALMVAMVPGLCWYTTIAHRPGFQKVHGFQQAWSIITHWSATAVLGAWLALILSRRWRLEPSWIDRAGRCLGAYWVTLYLGILGYMLAQRGIDLLSRGGTW